MIVTLAGHQGPGTAEAGDVIVGAADDDRFDHLGGAIIVGHDEALGGSKVTVVTRHGHTKTHYLKSGFALRVTR
jgi:hypothetical protein